MRWFGRRNEVDVEPKGPAPRVTPKREVPIYSRLIERPTRALPDELAAHERGEQHQREIDACRQWLEAQPPLPDDAIVLTSLVASAKGVVTIDAGDGARAALYFSSPLRAADYRGAVSGAAAGWQYIALAAPGMLRMLRDLERMGVTRCCFDRCPRCNVALVIQFTTITTAADVRALSQVCVATTMARSRLYHSYAQSAARAGRLEEALEVALECAGHVTLEEGNVHLLIGQLGVVLQDPALVNEARALLKLIGARGFAEELDRVVAAGTADFEGP